MSYWLIIRMYDVHTSNSLQDKGQIQWTMKYRSQWPTNILSSHVGSYRLIIPKYEVQTLNSFQDIRQNHWTMKCRSQCATNILRSNIKVAGSVLSPLLVIIVLEALSREFRTGCPWELMYADDLMISAESMEELLITVQTWKTEMEKKGLRVNMGKTKIMESGINLDVLKKSGKYPCGVCQSGVGSSNAIFCGGCKRWVHKKRSGIKGPLRPDPEFRCARCLGTARTIDEREVSEVEVGNEKLEVVPEFCYLGDMLSAGGGCELAVITRCKCAWGKFPQLLPLLTNRHLPLLTRG